MTATDTLHLSDLAPSTIQSEIRAMSVACDAIGGVNLAQGVCDTDASAHRRRRRPARHPRRPQHLHPPRRHRPPAPRHRRPARPHPRHLGRPRPRDPHHLRRHRSLPGSGLRHPQPRRRSPPLRALLRLPRGMLRSLRAVPVPVAMSVPQSTAPNPSGSSTSPPSAPPSPRAPAP